MSAEIIEDRVQVDGRRMITERHVDGEGREEFVRYLADADTDADAVMADRIARREQAAQDALNENEE